MDIGIIGNKQETLESLFSKSGSKYVIPFFQREFSWKKDDWEDFLDDLLKSKVLNRGHFFGFMTFKRPIDGEISIIEGQQRLTVVTIFLCVIRDIFFEIENDNWWKIENQFIKHTDILSTQKQLDTYKLVLSDVNKDFFIKYVQKEGKPREKLETVKSERRKNSSNELIIGCYRYLYEGTLNQIKDFSDPDKEIYLLDIIKTLLRTFVVISTAVTIDI